MTCQHCQTWNLDDEPRCRRCGRRLRNSPARISPATYPIAATATALAYEFDVECDRVERNEILPASAPPTASVAQQQIIFAPSDSRVIPFRTTGVRNSPEQSPDSRSRLPLRTGKAAQTTQSGATRSRKHLPGQQPLDFFTDVRVPPKSSIIGDTPVASPVLRLQAALIDSGLVMIALAAAVLCFILCGGHISWDKHTIPFAAIAAMTIPIAYKVLWTAAGVDSFGMRTAGLRLVDFDGNPPSPKRRYQRLFGAGISALAAGIGLLWALVDCDKLTWHDHMSDTFPTVCVD